MTTEQMSRTIERIDRHIAEHPYDAGAYADLLSVYKAEIDGAGMTRMTGQTDGAGSESIIDGMEQLNWHEANRKVRDKISRVMAELYGMGTYRSMEAFNIQYRRSLLMDALVDFDAYMQYIESDREPSRRFWLPRRGILKPVADEMAQLADGDLRLLSISLPPGTGKSTLAIFFLTWIGGKWPDEYSIAFSHDGEILKGMYGEVLRIISPDGEYLWKDVFPDVPLVSTNAKDLRIDLGHGSRFETFQFGSVGSENAGKLRASKLLYCDDLVGSIEQAMSKERLDKLWTQYTTDIEQRGTGDWRELHIGTRWSVWDVIGRLERQEADNPTGRARFISVPALNERDESNFDYPGIANKFTTEKYRRIRESMDDVNWRALYMNQPIEREGLLYKDDELRRYFTLPDAEPDGILAVCDTKDRGPDYCVLPIAYQYGSDYYIECVVCDNGNPEIVEPRVAQACVAHRVHMARFESNSAGGRVAESVQEMIRASGGRTSVSTKYTTQNKETKILLASPFVKEHFLFRDNSVIRGDEDYRKFMGFVCSYTTAGKNKHDDCVDALAMLADFVQSLDAAVAVPFRRPF